DRPAVDEHAVLAVRSAPLDEQTITVQRLPHLDSQEIRTHRTLLLPAGAGQSAPGELVATPRRTGADRFPSKPLPPASPPACALAGFCDTGVSDTATRP